MSGVRTLNKNADVMGAKAALHMNIHAAGGLQDVMKTNLGPRGTIKMLVSGAGDIKLTKVRLCGALQGAPRLTRSVAGLTGCCPAHHRRTATCCSARCRSRTRRPS